MDSVLDALGGLIIRAIPTFLLLFLLHFYLKWAFYGPMDRLLRRRWEMTDGARRAAQESVALAEQKAAAHEQAIRTARAELFREHENLRARWRAAQATGVAEVRRKTDGMVAEAKAALARDTETARSGLQAESEAIAEQIAGRLLERRAS